ncbi:hypothetical protein [Nocardioides sp.]|uniref:hypothetical protein n=1 Tax=Nocardioides sp. TaxID=35761 RepID=UPI002E363938|nr:hypothetical protein [Nocardioides sp.]
MGLSAPLALARPAEAAPGDPVWTAAGDGTVHTVSDGTASAAQMTYEDDGTFSGSWTFTATATSTGTVTVPYSWQGLHAWFEVTARLDTVVNGSVTGTLVNDGPVDCCTSPSNGFLYGGVATFQVHAGDTYGFRLSGSNDDFNDFLRGTFTLSTKPYLDANLGTDNRQWTGATELDQDAAADGNLTVAGEARWYKIPVVPGQQVTVKLSNLPADDDVALYGDIGAAFDQLSSGSTSDLSQLAAASAQTAPGSSSQVPQYPAAATTIPTSNVTPAFAPRIYAPDLYAPRIYAPSAYAPRIYAPSVYAPRIYAPDAYDPSLSGDAGFSDAFSAAQNQTLLAVSANSGTQAETVTAPSGNTSGFFYVRVEGHTALTPAGGFHVADTVTDANGTDCGGLTDDSSLPLALTPPTDPTQQAPQSPDPTDPTTVIVTDTDRLGLAPFSTDYDTYLSSLDSLASATNGVRLDVAQSPRVQALWAQVDANPSCPYAVNLVASAVKQLVDSSRSSASKYVVLAGGDDVIPFFRYPDVSGLGEESLFSPPVQADTPSGASLLNDQVQSQDAYGTETSVTIGGVTLPVPDLAVGRLVKTPGEIESTVSHYLGLDDGTLPAPTSSLVTGYDFLADAADGVEQEFRSALPAGTNDTLIDHPNQDDGTADNWNADQLSHALLDSHHDLVYLAGHFSANDTLAADFKTGFDDRQLTPDALEDTVVLSAGCHSGYNIVDSAAVLNQTDTFDWTEAMADQHAVLIGGTGYQYGDSDFLEYSERVYLDIAKRLHEETPGDSSVAVGTALVQAKQDYLSGLSTVSGIDQKAMLEATLYGLPMTGLDAPARSPIATETAQVAPQPVSATTPGATFGLETDDESYDTPLTTHTKDSGVDPTDPAQAGLPAQSTWLAGRDGVSVLPGAPAIPKQIEDVTAPGEVLRGVGFRSADYTDSTGILPVTGAPAIEGSTPNTTFESDAFFPQRLLTPNYFDTLGGGGHTSLILSPAQYESDAGGALTDTQRAYSNLGVRLFYSGSDGQSFGQNQPLLAAAPSIGNVSGTVTDGVVTFSATVTGDPSAGVQQVWVTWTGTGSDTGFGHWRSVDLSQDPNDSTHWTGTLALPSGQSSGGMRFLVQAANGVGAVGLDTSDGDGYRVFPANADTATVLLQTATPSAGSPFGVTATVTNADGPVQGRTVRFTVSRNGTPLFQYADASAADGTVVLQLPAGQGLPSGKLSVQADLIGDDGEPADSHTVQIELATATITLSPTSAVALPALTLGTVKATVTDGIGPVAGVPVTFTLPTTAPGAVFPGLRTTATVTTNAQGVAVSPKMTSRLVVGTFGVEVSAPDAVSATEAMATQYLVVPFASPVRLIGNTTVGVKGKLHLTTALLRPIQLIPDKTAQALVAAHRVQIRWRQAGTTGLWTARTDLVTYTQKKHTFDADLVASTLGWVKGKSYNVSFRILPGPTDVVPTGNDPVNGSFDLGDRSFTVQVTG